MMMLSTCSHLHQSLIIHKDPNTVAVIAPGASAIYTLALWEAFLQRPMMYNYDHYRNLTLTDVRFQLSVSIGQKQILSPAGILHILCK